jgi:hypothetical protein
MPLQGAHLLGDVCALDLVAAVVVLNGVVCCLHARKFACAVSEASEAVLPVLRSLTTRVFLPVRRCSNRDQNASLMQCLEALEATLHHSLLDTSNPVQRTSLRKATSCIHSCFKSLHRVMNADMPSGMALFVFKYSKTLRLTAKETQQRMCHV